VIDARCLTVGPIQENTWIVRREESDRALLIDPGDEPDRIKEALEGLTVEAILLTHTHFDHVGAVAPLARHTGAPVHCPEIEVPVLQDINRYTFPGFGPYESYDPEETLQGGEHLELAGLAIDVLFTPGHSPGHVSFSLPGELTLLSGDVLFQGSVGRVDLPGGDGPTLLASIAMLLDTLPDDTRVLPGHMGTTTLGRERATNPFLHELAR
jgi:hydroxyacylglutathione hydrolase